MPCHPLCETCIFIQLMLTPTHSAAVTPMLQVRQPGPREGRSLAQSPLDILPKMSQHTCTWTFPMYISGKWEAASRTAVSELWTHACRKHHLGQATCRHKSCKAEKARRERLSAPETGQLCALYVQTKEKTDTLQPVSNCMICLREGQKLWLVHFYCLKKKCLLILT